MQIQTERLLLRPITPDDLETACAYAMDPDVTRLMMLLPYDDEAEAARALQDAADEWGKARPARWEFAIDLNGRHIGSITCYFQDDPTEMELGWVLHRDHWRHGYITEAARALIAAAPALGVRRIFACCDSENIASYKTMEKIGMHHVATVPGRHNRGMAGERVELVYELLLNEPEGENGNAEETPCAADAAVGPVPADGLGGCCHQ